jgi:hypothetical protein
VRQGSPLGPYLYILQSEPLAETIRRDPLIKGVKVPSTPGNMAEIKLAAFADDTQGYISTLDSINRWMYHLYVYGEASGAVINADKTMGTLLGTLKNDHNRDNIIQWKEGPIKALGVNQGTKKGEVEFWKKKIAKMKQTLNIWKMRNLTLAGRAYLLKSVGISILLYAAELQSVPEYVKQEVNRIIWEFIWGGKNDKVKRDICIRKLEEGGLNAPDFGCQIDVSRLKMLSKILEDGNENWKILPRFFLRIGRDKCLLQHKVENRNMPMFYQECIGAWYKLKCEKNPKIKTVIDMLYQANNTDDMYSKIEIRQGDDWCDIGMMSKADLTTVVRAPLIKYVNETKWETHFSDIDWVQVYRIMGQKTIPRKIREFQWKIINWAVYTENRLKHVASTDGLCCLCGTEVETVTHMLVDCETVREYWTAVLILITKNIPSFVYNEQCTILGCTDTLMSIDEQNMANFIILNAKWIIWKRRCVKRYEGIYVSEQDMWKWLVKYIKSLIDMRFYMKSGKCKQMFNTILIE